VFGDGLVVNVAAHSQSGSCHKLPFGILAPEREDMVSTSGIEPYGLCRHVLGHGFLVDGLIETELGNDALLQVDVIFVFHVTFTWIAMVRS